ncbi:dihydrolipoyl dehydrogenase [Archaeoglobus neptunius]|uniref:dihydrolipoyl dehydrogenase n=1 Tax=Archaeoglobus neptunius TaxID=2798580 RepID=UPI00192551B9|nr:dihydrolipoyl dehydrogenase [Archaeoglobus neptunius]
MKKYDAIVIGTGSGMIVVESLLNEKPDARIAVIDKDRAGGICLTRGCIPSKLIVSLADVLYDLEKLSDLIIAGVERVDFEKVMERMRNSIYPESEEIEKALRASDNIDYYRSIAKFKSSHVLSVDGQDITSKKIFIGSGSRPLVPKIKGLSDAGYLTSDTILNLREMPDSLAVIGGGYVAVEYGSFFARIGCDVTIVEMMPRILHSEEPEISRAVEDELVHHATVLTSHRVVEVKRKEGRRIVVAEGMKGRREIECEEILVAVGRAPNSDILKPENAGIETTKDGWIKVDEYLETNVPGIYVIGDANGKHMFRHVANREAIVAYLNAFHNAKIKMDYSVVPHAVFCQPEVASVGMGEKQAVEKFGKENVLVGYEEFSSTGVGIGLNLSGFAKVIVHRDGRILGAHIVGRSASVMIQEIVTAMSMGVHYRAITNALHIHPALSEVVSRAFGNLMTVDEYHQIS